LPSKLRGANYLRLMLIRPSKPPKRDPFGPEFVRFSTTPTPHITGHSQTGGPDHLG
jgi:hypothetical protein